MAEMVMHRGGCHCGAVRFEAFGPNEVSVWKFRGQKSFSNIRTICSCSICKMKQNHHFFVPNKHFNIVKGKEELTEYRFGEGVAQHLFCRICGIQSFYRPRCLPNDFGVTVHCVDSGTISNIIWRSCEGSDWESGVGSIDFATFVDY